ncbi:MAG: hypothetical protein WA843_01030 [Candidatus Saccharimonadales bacterium]
MTTTERADFQIPAIEERDDLVLARDKQDTWTPGSIGAAANRAAKVAHKVLGVEAQWAEDLFTGQLEAMDLKEVSKRLVPIVDVPIGAEDKDGRIWTPSHVINGHDTLTTENGVTVPKTSIWPEMYANRSAVWWNRTRPEGESQLAEAPLRVVLADIALRGTKKNWEDEQAELLSLINGHCSDTTTLEGMTPLGWEMMDADAIVGNTDRPNGVTRFVQQERDRSVADGLFGPGADVGGSRAYLHGWFGHAYPGDGFRAVMGQKQSS